MIIQNRYILLRIRMLLIFLLGGKVSPRKVFNTLRCFAACALGRERSAASPFMVTLEPWNECNERCLFCRTREGVIRDANPANQLASCVTKGKMPVETLLAIIDELKKDLLLAVLYMNGEPLIYKDIFKAIRHCTDSRVATMIASNGILLDAENSRKLMEAGLDFIKIHVSGFTREVHAVQHPVGDIEKIKENLRAFMEIKRRQGHRTLLLADYILYRHNAHELEQFRAFCKELGIALNVRPGLPRGMDDGDACFYRETPPGPGDRCDWPWKVLSVNWDGALYPCCDFTVYGGAGNFGVFQPGRTSLREIWNGKVLRAFRRAHVKQGRVMQVCSQCARKGTAFRL